MSSLLAGIVGCEGLAAASLPGGEHVQGERPAENGPLAVVGFVVERPVALDERIQ